MVALRPYQLEQRDAVEAAWLGGTRAVLIEAATGTGKTVSAGEVVSRCVARGKTVLFLAHRWELIKQAVKEFRETFALLVGIERGKLRAGHEPVVCATVQTLKGERLAAFPRDAFDVIVIDECHHAPSPSYRAILAHFFGAQVLGVTATPDRADAVPLGSVFQHVAHRFGIEPAVAAGYLVPVRGVEVTVPGLDLSSVRVRRQMANGSRVRPQETIDLLAPSGQARSCPLPDGSVKKYSVDLHPKDLGRVANVPAAVEGVVIPLLALAGARRTIVFCVDKKHAEAIAGRLNEKRPGCAAYVHDGLTQAEREEATNSHKRGDVQFLCNVMLLTEGYNDPAIECVAMCRPTMSRVLYAQAVGRALRLFTGKVEALLLDFVGVGGKFDLVGPEDVLGKVSMPTPLEKYEAPLDSAEAARRAALGLGPIAKAPTTDSDTTVTPVADAAVDETTVIDVLENVTFTTKTINLIRGAGRGVATASRKVGGFFGRLFGW